MMIWSMLLAIIVIGSTCLVASQFNLSRSLGERRHKNAETKGLNLLLDNLERMWRGEPNLINQVV